MKNKDWFISQFPESFYLCNEKLIEIYNQKVLKGCELAEKSNIALKIIGQANKITIARINRISNMFSSCDFFIDKNKTYDFVIVIDTNVCGGYSYEGILNSLGWDVWDGIGSNAFIYNYIGNILHRQFNDSLFRKLNNWNECKDIENITYDRGEPPIRCFSCFGGMAIYKGNVYKELETLSLNKNIIDSGGTIWLNPSMITLYNNTQYSEIC